MKKDPLYGDPNAWIHLLAATVLSVIAFNFPSKPKKN